MTPLKPIASFSVDHDRLPPGLYVSRKDGDATTYDLRFKRPNGGDYLANAALHTLEHLGAVYLRNGRFADRVLYFGPMGCRTGFYLLLRDLPETEVPELVRETLRFVRDYEGEIPGSTRIECGNFEEHDLAGARREAEAYLRVLEDWTAEKMQYPT